MEPATEHPGPPPSSSRRSVVRTALLVLVLVGLVVGGLRSWWLSRPNVDELLESAEAAMRWKEFRDAQRLATSAARRAPERADAWWLAGQAAGQRGAFEDAVRLYDRNPDNGSPVSRVADSRAAAAELLLYRLHRAEDAERQFRAALIIDSDHVSAGRGLSVLLAISGRRREAVRWIRRRIEAGDVTVDELNMLDAGGGTRYETDLMTACRKRVPEDPVALMGVAAESLRTHRFDQAVELSSLVMAQHRFPVVAGAVMGRGLLETDRFQDLLTWQRGLSDGAETDPEVWMIRGEYQQRFGAATSAARCFWEVLRIDPDHRAANYRLAELLQGLKGTQAAEPFRVRTRQLQELKAINDRAADRGATVSPTIVRSKVELLRRMGRLWEAWGWTRVIARQANPPTWATDLQRELAEEVPRDPPRMVQPARNPANGVDLAEWSTGKWPAGSLAGNGRTQDDQDGWPRFRNDASAAGVEMKYVNGGDPDRPGQQMFEFTGGGVAVLDFDRDGWPDLYFTQGSAWPVDLASTVHTDRLFRNLGDGRFEDVTEEAGLSATGFGQGVTVGDFDGDGWPDLHVGNIGENRLYHNNGDGTFVDTTGASGVTGDRWTTSSAIADIDGDGVADLYVVNYLSGSDVFTRMCRNFSGRSRMCQPFQFPAAADRLYLGQGDGTFADVTGSAGVDGVGGKGLGLVVAGFDGDSGRLGVFVANDTRANFLYRHGSDSRAGAMSLHENGLVSGAGLNGNGRAEGSMGVAAGDADGDGRLDLFVTNFLDETNTFYGGLGQGRFNDTTQQAGLAASSHNTLGFGTQFLDADLDGDLDLVVTNGHVDDYTRAGRPYRMAPQYYRNRGDGRFDLGMAEDLGPHFAERYLGRGLARLDWNRDGRPDVVITAVDVPAVLLTNSTEASGHWLVLRLVGTMTQRDAIGAQVVVTVDGKTRVHQLTAGDGYHASNDRRLLLGLGRNERVEELEVRWPRGRLQKFSDVAGDRELVVVEGRGLFSLPFDRSGFSAP